MSRLTHTDTPSLWSRLARSKRNQRRMSIALRLLLAVVVLAFSLFPIAWTVSAAFNPSSGLTGQALIPAQPTLNHFRAILTEQPFPRWMGNSILVGVLATALSVLMTMLAAFSFSRFRFPVRNNLLLLTLMVQVFPALLAMTALYALMRQIGEYVPALGLNSRGGLVLLYMGGALGINVWLMKGFFDSIPREIDESAAVEGATHWQVFWRIIFPLARPIIAVIALLTFVGIYSDWGIARIMIQDQKLFTLMLGLQQFIQYDYGNNWGAYAAGAVLGALPIVILYILLQDFIIGGLTQGAVKG